jgi:transposase InsO family protein
MTSPLWITRDQVCIATGYTPRYIQRKVVSGEIETRDTQERGRNGRILKEYSAASLPPEAVAKLAGAGAVRSEEYPNKRPVETPASELSLTPLFAQEASAASGIGQPLQVALTPQQEKEAERKLAILRPLLDYIADATTRDRFSRLRLSDGRAVTNSELLSRYLAEQHNVGRSALWAWKKAYETDGRFGLVRKPNKNKSTSTWAAAHRDLADIAAAVYIGTPQAPGQSKRVAWETVCERARNIGAGMPSYETVRAFLDNPREVSPSMRIMGREGRRRYDAVHAPFIRRGYTEPAQYMWVSDHAIIDTLVQNDLFGACDLRHMRLRMTTLLDHRSRFVVGVSWCEEGSSHSIKRALLRAISRFGLPENFLCDNGKDYRKIADGARRHEIEAAKAEHAECWKDLDASVMKRLQVPVTFSIPFHPQSKHIERYHRTFHERVDKKFRTYTGGATHLRPDHTTENLARHGKLLQMGQTHLSALPLASQYIEMAEAWIDGWYHAQPHDGEGMDGRSPAEVYLAERSPNARPVPEPALLAMLLNERTTRKVQNCAITLGRHRLVPGVQDQAAYFAMHELSGREVVIAYDPLEPNFAAVLDGEMRFVCKLESEQLYRQSSDAETRANIGAFIQNRSGLAKAVKQSQVALHKRVTARGGIQTGEERLREMAQLPAAVGDNVVHRVAPTALADAADTKQFHSDDIAERFLSRRAGGALGAQG